MPSKKKPVTLTYKIGGEYTLTKTPKSLGFLKGKTMTVSAANSKDVTFMFPGVLVVSRDEIKRKLFSFKLATKTGSILTPVQSQDSGTMYYGSQG